MPDRLTKFTQENILGLLTFDTNNFLLVRNAVTPDLFDYPYNKIAERAIDYIDTYKSVAGDHIADLFEPYLNTSEGSKYQEALKSLLIFRDSKPNYKFILDRLIEFIREKVFENAMYDAVALKQKGKFEEAVALMRTAANTNITLFDPGIKITDLQYLTKSLEDEDILPTGVLALDKMKVGPAKGQVFLFLGKKSSGKAQPLTSKILTPYGWRLMGDIKEGDKIIGVDGVSYPVLKVTPQGIKDVYIVTFSDGCSTRVCKDHLWEVNLKSRFYNRKSENNVIGTKSLVISTEEIIKRGIKYKSGQSKFYIPEIENPIKFEVQENHEISPYNLGLLLGDGGFSHTGVTITTADNFILSSLKAEFSDLKFSLTKDSYSYRISYPSYNSTGKNRLINILRNLKLMGHNASNKFVPDQYKYGSVESRLAILQGLSDTDGSPAKLGQVDFISKSKQLSEDVAEIVRSLGGKCRVSKSIKYCVYKGIKRYGVYWRCNFTLPQNICPFKLPRKVERFLLEKHLSMRREFRSIESIKVDKGEEMQCLTVNAPRGLYITDDYIVTHNSFWQVNLGKHAAWSNYKVAHISLEINKEIVQQRYIQNIFALTRWEAIEVIKSPLFVRDQDNRVLRTDQSTIHPRSLAEPDIIEYVRTGLEKIGPRIERNVRIKDFHTGQLTITGLRNYLDGLEKTENFIPDLVILDMPMNMAIPVKDFRLAVGRLYIELRGLSMERNFALSAAHQISKLGSKARVAKGEHAAEDWSIMGTVDTAITYNQSDLEQKQNIARLWVDRGRSQQSLFAVLIAQNYKIAQFCLDSERMKDYVAIENDEEAVTDED